MAATVMHLLLVVVIGYILDMTSGLVVKSEPNMESIFADNEDLYHQYQRLNTVVKRQTKGSCSCTCETKPVLRYTNDHSESRHTGRQNSSDMPRADHSAKILRTGGVNSGSQHPVWSLADSNSYQETPEVDGENRMMEESRGDEEPHDQQSYGGEWGQGDQHAPSAADNRDSDISWGHGSRFPWLHLSNEMCFRKQCSSNLDCCRKFNLCDRSASVCVDCWYGSTCTSEAQCCEKFPYCDMSREPNAGRCVDSL